MTDKIDTSAHAIAARKQLVDVVEAMLSGNTSFFKGARDVCELRSLIDGVSDSDKDFYAFALIYAETNYLPHEEQRHLWTPETLDILEEYFERVQIWASSFAPKACESLLRRFAQGTDGASNSQRA